MKSSSLGSLAKIKKTPNARFLFVKREGEQIKNWQQGLERVEGLVREDPAIEEAGTFSDLYFFSSPVSTENNLRYWVGREIIGPLFQGKGEFLVCDLDQDECYEFRFVQRLEDWEDLFREEEKWRKKFLQEFSVPLALTWRLRFDMKCSDIPVLNFFIRKERF